MKIFLLSLFVPILIFGEYLYINEPVVNLYEYPNPETEVMTQAIWGMPFTILTTNDHWIQIDTEYGQGWIKQNQIITRKTPYPDTENTAKVNLVWTHLYQEPNLIKRFPKLTLPFDAEIEVISDPNVRWIKVQLLDGTSLWTQNDDWRFNSTLITKEEMLELSKKFLGLPYIWDGTSGFGLDCSGFVLVLFRQMGIDLPRYSYDQACAKNGANIPLNEIEKGDLLFFGDHPGKVCHVGLYLGENTFIHTCVGNNFGRPAMVQISSFEDIRKRTLTWGKALISAKRFQ